MQAQTPTILNCMCIKFIEQHYLNVIFLFSFITLSACNHLDGKHTIFGRLVGGGNTLIHIENVESDPETSRPLVVITRYAHFYRYNCCFSLIGADHFYGCRNIY